MWKMQTYKYGTKNRVQAIGEKYNNENYKLKFVNNYVNLYAVYAHFQY